MALIFSAESMGFELVPYLINNQYSEAREMQRHPNFPPFKLWD